MNQNDQNPIENMESIETMDWATILPQAMEIAPDILYEVLGRKVPLDELKNAFSSDELKRLSVQFVQESSDLRDSLNPNHLIPALYTMSNEYIRAISQDISDDETGIDHAIRKLGQNLEFPDDKRGFFNQTSYDQYKEAISKLVHEVCSIIDENQLKDFFNDVDSSGEDIIASGQMLVATLKPEYKFLARERKRHTSQMAERCLGMYEKLSGVYEKGIAIVVGLVQFVDGTAVDYSQIRRRSLKTNIDILERTEYAILANGFDRLMRNAIAHTSYWTISRTRVIRFSELSGSSTWEISYKDILNKTRELVALIVPIYQLRLLIALEQLRLFQDIAQNLIDHSDE